MRKVVDAYELLGLLEEKNRVLQKYDDLFNSSSSESPRKLRKFSKRGIAAGKMLSRWLNLENLQCFFFSLHIKVQWKNYYVLGLNFFLLYVCIVFFNNFGSY